MKLGFFFKTCLLTFLVFNFGLPIFAQQSNGTIIPEGKWVLDLEYVQTSNAGCSHGSSEEHDCQNTERFNTDGIEFYTYLEVKGNAITLSSTKHTLKAKYTYRDEWDGITFDSATVPFSPGGKLIDGRLYFQQPHVDKTSKGIPSFIALSYTLKK